MSNQFWGVLQTSLGWFGALASDKGIQRLSLPESSPEKAMEKLEPKLHDAVFEPDKFEGLRTRLERYLTGDPTPLDDTLDLAAYSPFFLRAWSACRSIPRGETRSYAWLAIEAGSPRAVRAAGQAMARNPVAIVVPCHRVIGSDGKLCGYGGGLNLKTRLLEMERAVPI